MKLSHTVKFANAHYSMLAMFHHPPDFVFDYSISSDHLTVLVESRVFADGYRVFMVSENIWSTWRKKLSEALEIELPECAPPEALFPWIRSSSQLKVLESGLSELVACKDHEFECDDDEPTKSDLTGLLADFEG